MNKVARLIFLSMLLHGSKALGVEVLGTYRIPKHATIKRMIISPYSSKLLLVLSKDGKEYLRINDSLVDDGADNLTLYESYGERLYTFSKGGKEYIKAGNRSYGPITRLEDHRLSKDGNSYLLSYNVDGDTSSSAYVEKMGGRWYVVHDGDVFGPYKNIRTPRLSEDGAKCIFSFQRGNNWYVKSEDSIKGPYKQASVYGISNDGRYWAYTFSIKLGDNYASYGKKLFGPYNYAFIRLDDEGHYLLEGINKGNIYYIRNDTTWGPLESIFSSGWRHLACRGTAGSYLYTGQNIYGPYPVLRYSYKNDTAKRIGFTYRDSIKAYWVNIDGKVVGPFEEAYEPIFSQDEKQYGFIFKENNNFKAYINGNIYGPYDSYSIICSDGPFGGTCNPKDILFSNDGKSFALQFKNDGKAYVQTNNAIYGGYDYAISNFTGNGSLCIVYFQNKMRYLQIDKALYGPYALVSTLVSKDNKFLFAYQNGDSVNLMGVQ
jgi:hypothetical protein